MLFAPVPRQNTTVALGLLSESSTPNHLLCAHLQDFCQIPHRLHRGSFAVPCRLLRALPNRNKLTALAIFFLASYKSGPVIVYKASVFAQLFLL